MLSAGDVNADGYDDIIIGARGAYEGNGRAGASYVVFGKVGGFAAEIDLSPLDGKTGFRLTGDFKDYSSSSVSSAGDLNGDGSDDVMVGAPGDDNDPGQTCVVYGRAPTEAVTRVGSSSDQTIHGGEFDDTLSGTGGNDRLAGGGGGADMLHGGTGKDWAYYDVAKAGVRASLASPDTNTGEAASDWYTSIENLQGSAFADTLVGNNLDNRLRCDDGANKLSSCSGDDVLVGGSGHGRLIGGKGADAFQFSSLSSTGSDTITDFTSGVGRIVLDDVFGLPGGTRAPDSFVVGGTAQDADDRLIYDALTGKLFFDADGTGASAQVLIATLKAAPTLTAGDFQVDGAAGALPISAIEGPSSDAVMAGSAVLKDGTIHQVALDLSGARSAGRVVRTMKLASQSEGCVVDPRTHWLYVAEEDVGVWRFDAVPDGATQPVKVAGVDGRAELQAGPLMGDRHRLEAGAEVTRTPPRTRGPGADRFRSRRRRGVVPSEPQRPGTLGSQASDCRARITATDRRVRTFGPPFTLDRHDRRRCRPHSLSPRRAAGMRSPTCRSRAGSASCRRGRKPRPAWSRSDRPGSRPRPSTASASPSLSHSPSAQNRRGSARRPDGRCSTA